MSPAADIAGKVILVTGANSGLGEATASQLAKMGAKVTITARDLEAGRAAVERICRNSKAESVELMELDLASFASIRTMAASFLDTHDRLDVLVNNAGVVRSDRTVTEDGFETTFGVNHLGPFLLTSLLQDLLVRSAPSRIVNVASEAHRSASDGLDFEDLQGELGYRAWPAYCQSKLANVYFTIILAEKLAGTGVTVNAVNPGVVATRFGQDGDLKGWFGLVIKIARPFLSTPTEGAMSIVFLASSPEVADVTGAYFNRVKRVAPSRAANDHDAAERLWQISEGLIASVS